MGFVVTWFLLAALWLALSGFLDTPHLVFGFCSVTLVSLLSHRHVAAGDVAAGIRMLLGLALYAPWLLWQIVVANVDVFLRIAGFRDIEPHIIRFRPELKTDFGRVTLANSITLTPGTVTVAIEDGEFIVHALSREAADAVLEGSMARKVAVLEGPASDDGEGPASDDGEGA